VTLASIPLGEETESKTDVQPEAGAWLYDIANLRVENIGLALADRGYSPAVAYDVTLDLSRGGTQGVLEKHCTSDSPRRTIAPSSI
jgi:hypothetical protein